MEITAEQFEKCFPALSDSAEWLAVLNTKLPEHGIESPDQVAMFLAQTGHESGDFKFLKENLNYSAKGLLATFPKHFDEASANECARNPEKIALAVYSCRMGNGDASTGEAYDYIGRGPIQITGKDNYDECSQFIYGDDTLLKEPDKVFESKEDSIMSAIWFWTKHNLADMTDIVAITKKINGGTIGLDDRSIRYSKYQVILAA